MENHNEMMTLEQFESNLKALLENNVNSCKYNEKNGTDSDSVVLANQLKNEAPITKEIANELEVIKKGIIICINVKVNHIYLVRGKDRGRNCWHYVLVDSNKEKPFVTKCNTGSADVKDYGAILCSGWGENPPQHQIDKMNNFYDDIKHNLFIHKEIYKTRCIYYYVLLDLEKQKAFDEQCNERSISIGKIQNYGKLLYTGYGMDPPEVIFLKMEKTYLCGNHLSSNIDSLHLAIQNNDLEATVFCIRKEFDLNKGDHNDWTSLHHGAYSGNLQIVKRLLENGADLDAVDSVCGRKPLHIAAKEGHLHIMKLLLSFGNVVDDVDKNNWTPLHYAAWNGHLEMVTFLISKGANIDATDFFNGKKPIHIAAREGYTEIVKLFLNLGMDIEDTDTNDRTCLYYAAWFGSESTAQFLIDKFANIDAENEFGTKCIHIAAMSNVIDIVKLFLNSGADINKSNRDGFTLLHLAVNEGDIEMIKFLIKEGANVNVKNKDGETPLDMAKGNKNTEILKALGMAEA